MENLHLIVGLGNPGAEYARTRHNAGFVLVDRIAEQWRCGWSSERKFQSRMARTGRGGRQILLCKPETFMNASGEAVRAVMDFYGVPLERLLVVVDDADLPLGGLRLRPGGGSGGHHGLESIERHLGADGFARQRIGIGRREGSREITGHVLGRFLADEAGLLERVLEAAAGQVETWLAAGIQKAMNQFNGTVAGSANEEKIP
jgi:PTH1 family peptidyl-tRNA hydrolase